MLDPQEYTVGWICGLVTEYVAAQAFLDEHHGQPDELAPNDNNSYSLGTIKDHNVVIAVLPEGEYGTSSAASVARDMLSSFPNIRIGLLVGIGSGVPSRKNDIRLGDVVVSLPSKGTGGVVQYDFGQIMQDQPFQTTGFLNQPPAVLRSAISGIRSSYESDGHQIVESIGHILEKKPRLKKRYARPESDKLYQSDFVHAFGQEENCSLLCNEPSKLIFRRQRTEDEDDPAIHYGLIGSANRVIEDAHLRDSLGAKGIVCLETMAAGLMNHYPCIVIRSICDYADSHKNNEWHGYASMTAAAYTKDLLYLIPPKRVEAERKIRDILHDVSESIDEIRNNVAKMTQDHGRDQITRWLSPSDPFTNYHFALQSRQEGTGTWFLESSNFQKWKEERNSFLWIDGIPGCGKTVLCTTIVETLDSEAGHLLFFYFDFNDTKKQTLENLIRTLIHQLYTKSPEAKSLVESLHSSHSGEQPSCKSLYQLFLSILEEVKEISIVIDALDECTTRQGQSTEGLIACITDLMHPTERRNVHLLVTSRPEQDIKSGMGNLSEANTVSLQSHLVDDDIRNYIRSTVRHGDALKRWQSAPDVQNEIESQLAKKADGMFRWVSCQIDVLQKCLDYRTLQKALVSLPNTLDATYDRILDSIPEEYQEASIRILQFLAFSERPLSIQELVDAIAVQTEGPPYFNPKHRMPDPQEITYYCSSLVVQTAMKTTFASRRVVPECAILRLSHFSVKEYLTSNRSSNGIAQNFQEDLARASMAEVCITYLLHIDTEPDVVLDVRVKQYPLTEYAAEFWMCHATKAQGEDERLRKLVTQFLLQGEISESQSFEYCFALYRPDSPWQHQANWNAAPSALYYAAFGGYKYAVEKLLEYGNSDCNIEYGYFGDALQAASSQGYEQIASILIDHGADIDTERGHYGNALHAASTKGHANLVSLLLGKGANPNIKGGLYGTALCSASMHRFQHIIRLLLEHGANIELVGPSGNALEISAREGHGEIVSLLLDNGASVHCHALFYAICQGYDQIAELLLDHGALVDCSLLMEETYNLDIYLESMLLYGGSRVEIQILRHRHKNALLVAIEQRNEHLVRLILERNAVAGLDSLYDLRFFLHTASILGHHQIVSLLLETGTLVTNPNETDGHNFLAPAKDCQELANMLIGGSFYGISERAFGLTPLEAQYAHYINVVSVIIESGLVIASQESMYYVALAIALEMGHETRAIMLIEKSSRIDDREIYHGHLLWHASYNGFNDIIKLLLTKGVDVNAREDSERSALLAASERGQIHIIELLFKNGFEADAIEMGLALHAAIEGYYEQTALRLIEIGADVHVRQLFSGKSTLYRAAYYGLGQIVKCLIAKGVDIHTTAGPFGTAIYGAVSGGRKEIVNLLSERDADSLTAFLSYDSEALAIAAEKGDKDMVKLLIEKGANVNSSHRGRTALQLASFARHESVVEVLLQNAADVNIGGRYSALRLAPKKGHESMVKLLIEHGAEESDSYSTDKASTIDSGRILSVVREDESEDEPKDEPEDDAEDQPEAVASYILKRFLYSQD